MIADSPPTIAQLPFFVTGRFPKTDTVGWCRGGGIQQTSARDFLDRIRDVSLGLSALAMARGDRVALVAESRPDWLVSDFAILAAGAVTTPIYPTLSAEQVAFILRDSEASLAVVSTPAQLEKVLAASASLSRLRAVVILDSPAPPAAGATVPVLSLDDVAAQGHRRILDGWGIGREFHQAAKQVQPSDLATIIYTSGTTGDPKGVMLTHANLAANLADLQQVLVMGPDDVALSFLPLCHAFERMVAYIYLVMGVSIVFAESIDTIARDLRAVRPTVMTGVPRVFEKLQERIRETGRKETGLKRAIFNWAMGVAARRGAVLADQKKPSWSLQVESRLADRLVFETVRAGVGGRFRFAVSGSAPLGAELGRFFYGLGLPILEGYGLTETAPVLAVNPLVGVRFGTVGKPLPSVDVRIADDGEILARGPNIMAGYYKRPGETAEAMRDGWFHTGDIGTLDADGYLRITDRKKELLVTSGGKKIAPQPIEAELRRHALITEAIVIADNRRFPSALIVPDFAALAARLGVPVPATADAAAALVRRSEAVSAVQAAIDEINRHLAHFETLKKFVLLPRELTLEAGELTPTLKVKRRVVAEHFRNEIETIYEAGLS